MHVHTIFRRVGCEKEWYIRLMRPRGTIFKCSAGDVKRPASLRSKSNGTISRAPEAFFRGEMMVIKYIPGRMFNNVFLRSEYLHFHLREKNTHVSDAVYLDFKGVGWPVDEFCSKNADKLGNGEQNSSIQNHV